MSAHACDDFRRSLAEALSGELARPSTTELQWHEHLLSCHECRSLLDAEEALEELLASLPDPHLPPDLARRVLARLELERHGRMETTETVEALDRLLDSSPRPVVPEGLGARVLRGLREARESATRRPLDELLELVPAPEPPPGLAERVLARLAPARVEKPRTTLRLLRGGRRLAAAAVVLGLGLGLTFLWTRTREPAPEPVDDELLATLDVLENWDFLMSDDIDLLLVSLDPVDWTLLEIDPDVLQADGEGGR